MRGSLIAAPRIKKSYLRAGRLIIEILRPSPLNGPTAVDLQIDALEGRLQNSL